MINNHSRYEIISDNITNKYGIIDRLEDRMLLDFEYDDYETIDNYFDLTLNNTEPLFKLYNFDTSEAQFCLIKDDMIFISKKYDRDSLYYFYRGMTICSKEDDIYVINIQDNIIKGPMNQDEFDTWTTEGEIEFLDLVNIDSIIKYGEGKNYGYKRLHINNTPTERMYYGKILDLTDYSCERFFEMEELIGKEYRGFRREQFQDIYNYSSSIYDQLTDFDYLSGTCLARIKNRLSIVNRYFFHVVDSFDDYLDFEVVWNWGIVGFQEWNDNHKDTFFIRKQDKAYKVRLKGNFIRDYFERPYLFFKYDNTLEFVAGMTRPDNHVDDNYWKVDQFVLEMILEDKREENPEIKIDEHYIFELLSSEYYLHTLCEYLPFDIKEVRKLPNLEQHLSYHNEQMGVIFSTFEILEEYLLEPQQV